MCGRVLVVMVAALAAAGQASAQNWSFDARMVGMGSPDGGGNLAREMIDKERNYRALVLPLGLLQVFSDFDRLNPTHDDFDLVRTIEFAAAPLHYTFDREGTGSGHQMVVDIRNAELERDLNVYRGFVPANQPTAQGLLSPSWGGTIRVHGSPGGPFQGIYIGAGPYVSMRTDLAVDEQLRQVLGSSTDVYVPNTTFTLGSMSRGQLAGAISAGYRGRFAWPGGAATGVDGLYVAGNVNYLRGFRYEDVSMGLRLDTDNAGLLTVNPAAPPLLVRRDSAKEGTGASVDVGAAAVVGPWEVGVGVRGIANRITWRGIERVTYSLDSLHTGDSDFTESEPIALGDARVTLPVDVRGHVAYTANGWTATGEVGRGLQGHTFRAGAEQRWSAIAVRGGASYSREMWNPAVGVGFNVSPGFGIDVALYGNSANVERRRNAAVALSLRFNQ